jgi:hypothetical protein
MKSILAGIFVLGVSVLLAQENPELDKRNGFKDIRLGMSVDTVKGARLKKEFTERGNVYPSQLYDVDDPKYAAIGEVKVRKIEVTSYRNCIYIISVIAEKDPRLMKALENIYGLATYDAKNNRYFWKSDSLILTYESRTKKQLMLEYRSLLVPKVMQKDREKKIDNIADDF